MSKETILLDNFADFHGEVNGVEVRANLPLEPYVPSSEINVNLGRIVRAAKFGHLGSVAFRKYSEQTSITPGIDGVGEDGSATASFSASATKTPRIDSAVRNAGILRKGSGQIRINLGHEDLDSMNLRDAGSWSQYLDASIGEGLRGCANKKLFHCKRPLRWYFAVSYLAIPALRLAGHDIQGAVGAYTQEVGAFTALSACFAGTEAEFTSLVPGLPLDRAGLVQAYTRSKRLVEPVS